MINNRIVGLILPSVNVHMEPEFYRMNVPGLNFHATRVMLKETTEKGLTEMEEDLEYAAKLIATVRPEVVAYACTSGSFLKGDEWDNSIMKKITKLSSCPSITTSRAVINAIHEMGIKKLTLVTPYIDDLNQREVRFFINNGIDVVNERGMQIIDADILHAQTAETVKNLVLETDTGDSDGVFISCTDFKGLAVAEELERLLKKPVVTSNSATMWAILKLLGYKPKIEGYGALLKEHL